MKENAVFEKSRAFGVRIVKMYKYLRETKREYVISKQVLRSGTSIGANINEANYAQSRADFISKMYIALKETAETEYWIRILTLSDHIGGKLAISLLDDCLEIKRILIATLNTAKTGSE